VIPPPSIRNRIQRTASVGKTHAAVPVPPPLPPKAPPIVRTPPPPPPLPPLPGVQTQARSSAWKPGEALTYADVNKLVPGSGPMMEAERVHEGVYELELDEVDVVEISDATEEEPEGTQTPIARAQEALERTPLFSDIHPDNLAHFIKQVELIHCQADEVVFRAGDRADGLYVIVEGSVTIWSSTEPPLQLNHLSEGEFFGEIALLTDQPRHATVRAEHGCLLVKMTRATMAEWMNVEPDLVKIMLRFVRERLVDALVITNPLLAPYMGVERRELAERFRFLEIEQGAVLIEQGDRAEGLFVLMTGQAEVVLEGDGAPQRRLALLESGEIFGEMSLLSQQPAVATVRALSKCFALRMPAKDFREVIMTHPRVLMFVGELAEQRERENQEISSGKANFSDGFVNVF
jgi:CRP-like cAMP-binding protein